MVVVRIIATVAFPIPLTLPRQRAVDFFPTEGYADLNSFSVGCSIEVDSRIVSLQKGSRFWYATELHKGQLSRRTDDFVLDKTNLFHGSHIMALLKLF